MNQLLIMMLLGASLLLSGCDKKEAFPPPTVNEIKQDAAKVKQEAATEAATLSEQAKQDRQVFVARMRKELDELDVKLAELNRKTQKQTGEAKARLELKMQDLKQTQKETERKLADLQAATADKWSELKQGVTEAVERFRQAIDKVNAGNR